jgi:hypothetical protein
MDRCHMDGNHLDQSHQTMVRHKLDPHGLLHDDVLRSGTIRGIRTPRQNPWDEDFCMSSD